MLIASAYQHGRSSVLLLCLRFVAAVPLLHILLVFIFSPLSSRFPHTLRPICTASNLHRVALTAGVTGLTKLFQRNKSLKENAGYLAHTVGAMALMVLASWIGLVGWWVTPTPVIATIDCVRLGTIVGGRRDRYVCCLGYAASVPDSSPAKTRCCHSSHTFS